MASQINKAFKVDPIFTYTDQQGQKSRLRHVGAHKIITAPQAVRCVYLILDNWPPPRRAHIDRRHAYGPSNLCWRLTTRRRPVQCPLWCFSTEESILSSAQPGQQPRNTGSRAQYTPRHLTAAPDAHPADWPLAQAHPSHVRTQGIAPAHRTGARVASQTRRNLSVVATRPVWQRTSGLDHQKPTPPYLIKITRENMRTALPRHGTPALVYSGHSTARTDPNYPHPSPDPRWRPSP